MKRRWVGYAVWLLLTACLYFFENNAGTRIMLLCSLLVPLVPFLRGMFFAPDGPEPDYVAPSCTVRSLNREEEEEPDGVRPYVPGDPIRRIHWKLSAKKQELLVREYVPLSPLPSQLPTVNSQRPTPNSKLLTPNPTLQTLNSKLQTPNSKLITLLLLLLVFIAILPEANRGAQALCNRLFAASERVNAYVYTSFPVPEDQSVLLASLLLLGILACLLALTVLRRSRLLALGLMAACSLFQVYFGLSFPWWINVPLYAALGLWMMKRPFDGRRALCFLLLVLLVSAAVLAFFPGVDAATESASESVRDRLSGFSRSLLGTAPELAAGETETRRVHTRSLETGDREAAPERTYRLVTEEAEAISMPRWIDWLKMILLLLLTVALVALPFAPFLLLNARRRKAREARKAFASEDPGEAVCAIFTHVIRWLCETGHDAGNRPFADWAERLPAGLPEGYADRFARCAADFEQAAYSLHPLPEESRRRALSLLRETEAALWQRATRKQRFRLKVWVCLCE